MALREEFAKSGNWLFRWRSYFPLLILPLLLVALGQSKYLEHSAGETAEYIWEGFCLLVSFSGLLVRCIVVAYAPKRTSGRNTEHQKAEVLNTTGLYSTVRHPLYLGNFLIFLGMVLFVQVVWFAMLAVLSFWLYYERIMFAEEEFLRGKFGDMFLQWAEKTPAFWPRFGNWQKPALTFSFRNILKREYTAFFLIIASFTLLDIGGDVFTMGELQIDVVWLTLFIIGLIIYLVLRTLRTKTRILHVEGR
ncbi:MAG: isoprenylcysteine carboxylmethyltransferase family protein [Nitrospirota bacterium]